MSGTNHITGGIVFTGIFASFWDVNIFSRPEFLAATGFFAILPDVDHLKSPIGKAFYPLARWLDRKYGHRTITHSLLVYLSLLAFVFFLENSLSATSTYTLIFAFAYFSHLLFDMLTKQGIPLFYPFKRNPCVIPGNPEMRLRSSDLKTEAACFAIFTILGITCQSLFANGFWNTYNRKFADQKHLYQEYRQYEGLLSVEYHYKTEAGNEISDTGFLIKATESKSIFWTGEKFHTLEKTDKIFKLVPTRTPRTLRIKEEVYTAISPDSLLNIVAGKPIVSLVVHSDLEFIYYKNSLPEKGKKAELEYVVNPVFHFEEAAPAKTDTSNIEARRRMLLYELAEERQRVARMVKERRELEDRLLLVSKELLDPDLYVKEKASREITKLKVQLERLTDIPDDSDKILLKLQSLKPAPLERNSPITINATIKHIAL